MELTGDEFDQPDDPDLAYLSTPWPTYTAAHLERYPEDGEIIQRINREYNLDTFPYWEF